MEALRATPGAKTATGHGLGNRAPHNELPGVAPSLHPWLAAVAPYGATRSPLQRNHAARPSSRRTSPGSERVAHKLTVTVTPAGGWLRVVAAYDGDEPADGATAVRAGRGRGRGGPRRPSNAAGAGALPQPAGRVGGDGRRRGRPPGDRYGSTTGKSRGRVADRWLAVGGRSASRRRLGTVAADAFRGAERTACAGSRQFCTGRTRPRGAVWVRHAGCDSPECHHRTRAPGVVHSCRRRSALILESVKAPGVVHSSFRRDGAAKRYDPRAALAEHRQCTPLGYMPDEVTQDFGKRMHYALWRLRRAATARDRRKWKAAFLALRDRVVLGNQKLVFKAVRYRRAWNPADRRPDRRGARRAHQRRRAVQPVAGGAVQHLRLHLPGAGTGAVHQAADRPGEANGASRTRSTLEGAAQEKVKESEGTTQPAGRGPRTCGTSTRC